MATLPQLIEEDILRLDDILCDFLAHTEATTALIIDKGGFLITAAGERDQFDLTTIAALASGSFMANQTIASMVQENNFSSVYQQGENYSMFIVCVDEQCLLVTIFKAGLSVGLVKYFALPTAGRIADQMRAARRRDPASGLDLSVLNMADPSEMFKKRS